MLTRSALTIRLHPNDDVVIARAQLVGGTNVLDEKIKVSGLVPPGHKVATRAIKAGEPVPDPMDSMTRVRVLADIPEAERPKIQVQNMAGPAFKAYADNEIKTKGPGFNICDLEIRAEVR